MDRGLETLIGMSIAYLASFLGLGLAWWAWVRRAHPRGRRTRPDSRRAHPEGEGE